MTLEAKLRLLVNQELEPASWIVQDMKEPSLSESDETSGTSPGWGTRER